MPISERRKISSDEPPRTPPPPKPPPPPVPPPPRPPPPHHRIPRHPAPTTPELGRARHRSAPRGHRRLSEARILRAARAASGRPCHPCRGCGLRTERPRSAPCPPAIQERLGLHRRHRSRPARGRVAAGDLIAIVYISSGFASAAVTSAGILGAGGDLLHETQQPAAYPGRALAPGHHHDVLSIGG